MASNRSGRALLPLFAIFLVLATTATEAAAPATPEEIFEAKHQEIRDALYAGKYEEAEDLARKYFAEAEEQWGEGSLKTGRFLDAVLLARSGNGKTHGQEGEETVAIGRRAVEIRKKSPEAKPADLAWALRNLGDLHRRRDENETAVGHVRRAIDVMEDAGEMETALGARLLNLQGLCERRLGNLELARDRFERSAALHLETSGEDSLLRGVALANLAASHQRMGDLSAALAVHREALEISERVNGPDHIRTSVLLSNQSIALSENGELDEARRTIERALAIAQEALRPDHPHIGKTLETNAIYSSRLGDSEAALEKGRRALEIVHANEGPESSRAVRVLTHLATFADRGGQPELAQEYFEQAIAVGEELENPEPGALSELFRLYGKHLSEHDRGNEAEERLLAAVDWAEKDPNLRFVARAQAIRHLGMLHVERGDFAKATPYLEEALADFEASLGRSHPDIASVHYYMGLARQGLGRRDAAMASAVASHDIQQRHLLDTVNALSETMALRYVAQRTPSVDLALSLLSERSTEEVVEETWNRVVAQRAIVLDELARRNQRLVAADDSELAEKIERYRSVRERLAHRTLADPGSISPEEHLRELEALERAKNEAGRDLAESGLGRGVASAVASGRDVRAALPAGSALVSFVRYQVHREGRPGEAAYAAFVMRGGERGGDSGSGCAFVGLGGASEVEASVSAWWKEAAWGGRGTARTRSIVRMSTNPEEQLRGYRAAGRELRRRIWDPVAPLLEGAERVFLVLDGELHQVSFAALPNDDETYLLETAPLIHLLSAERSLVRGRGAVVAGRGMLAVGGPDFDLASAEEASPIEGTTAASETSATSGLRGQRSLRADLGSLEFSNLGGARREATEVADIWKNAVGADAERDLLLLTGADADESAFKARAAGRSVIHLATHGFFLGRDDDPEAPAGEGGSRVPRAILRTENEIVRENPLLLSGLALAGANRRGKDDLPGGEDGIITAEEIAALDLSGVEWAVLSACETGAGTVRSGEGVFGLRRAFEVAGARTVIMSLWAVDDEATRDWMGALYRARFADRLATDEAVREASLRALRMARESGDSDHPFRWAAFVATGDWR